MTGWRTVSVAPERLAGWIARFADRHRPVESSLDRYTVIITGADGAVAMIQVAFPPLLLTGDLLASTVDHGLRSRRIGAVLVRKGGFAVGIFEGNRLVTSKVGSAYVQGKTKAGGWSQQRYARRRDNQAKKAYAEAADEVVHLLLPARDDLEVIVTGGDKPAVAAVFEDPRAAVLRALVTGPVLAVPDPRLRVLQAFPEQFRAVTIRLNGLA